MHALFLAVLLLGGPAAAQANPCTNGSFERLAPNGFPADWAPVGQAVEVVAEARSGQRALRLLRTPDTKPRETGLNRAWKPHSGQRGAMIDRLKGGIEFWYKAISAAEGTRLTVQAIPMTSEPIEGTDSPRAIFDVPREHVGDGQWHRGRLKYDFTGDPKAKWVHFAARILGRKGEMLLDDFAYVEKVGPILRISRLRLDEDPKRPGERGTVSALIENVGDAPATDTRASLATPPELRATPAGPALGTIAPDARRPAAWTLDGRRARQGAIRLAVASGDVSATSTIAIAPRLVLASFGPTAPVAAVGERVALECVVRNDGNAILLGPAAHFALGDSKATDTLPDLPPGQARVARARFTPEAQAAECPASVALRAGNAADTPSQATTLAVGAATMLPSPAGRLRAVATDRYALLENSRVRLAFRRNAFGFGTGELCVRTPRGWRTVAWLLHLAPFTYQSEDGDFVSGSDGFLPETPQAETTPTTARLRFADAQRFLGGTRRTAVTLSLRKGHARILMDCELSCTAPMKVACLGGPLVYALDRDEAVFPGLEWLVGDEQSSSSLDIAPDHPDRDRSMPHPNKVTIPAIGIHGRGGTVGLLWDAHQKWDGQRDRPAPIFDSPDVRRGQRAHLAGLLAPAGPEFIRGDSPSQWRPYPLAANRPIRVRGMVFADGRAADPLAAVDEWLRIYGLPRPHPLPHGSYEVEIQFSMKAYLESLWDADTKQWWTSKGGPRVMSKLARPRAYIADLLLGALVSPDEAVRKACRERAEEVAALVNAEPRLDAMRFPGRFDLAIANPARAAGLLATMGDDGAWRFDADQPGRGPFVGKDYHELGPDNAVEVGTCARKAFEVLRYARIAGDAEAYRRMQKTLRLMETFRVPRAAQVWEVPVHTPDLLAAADAADAYIEAYRFSGDERWLRDAVTWARRGIPFIYLWNPPDKPWLLGASIPVFGATWYRGSWFGRPVQWNGLRYANALLKLAEYDRSKPWRRLAELIIRSAIRQQDPDGENVALWPDNISAIDGTKCRWVFAPRQIIRNILKLTGRDEDPQTTILRRKPFLRATRRVHITTTAKVSDAAWDGSLLTFKAAFPQGEEGCVLVTNITRPTAVTLDGKPLAERADVEKGAEPGWRYDDALAYLCIRVAPAATPSVIAAPTATPSVITAPTATPSVITAPTATPSVIAAPTATPSVIAAPAATPSVIAAPAATPSVILSEAKDLSGEATGTTKVGPDGGGNSRGRFFASLRSAQNDKGVGAAQNDRAMGPAQNDRGAGQNDRAGRRAHYGLKAALQARAVRVEGARHRRVSRLPALAERLDFSFARSTEGWMAAHDVADLAARDGALRGRATGNDPYVVRTLVRMKGDGCPVLLVRLRATAGRSAQFFWATEASPGFAEDRSLRFSIVADGRFHDYRLELAKHPQWAGRTITAVRLDPCDAPGRFAIALVRGTNQ